MHSRSDLSYCDRMLLPQISGPSKRENSRTRPYHLLLVGQFGVFSVHFIPHLLHAFHSAVALSAIFETVWQVRKVDVLVL